MSSPSEPSSPSQSTHSPHSGVTLPLSAPHGSGANPTLFPLKSLGNEENPLSSPAPSQPPSPPSTANERKSVVSIAVMPPMPPTSTEPSSSSNRSAQVIQLKLERTDDPADSDNPAKPPRPRRSSLATGLTLTLIRLGIFSVGVSAIAGSVLARFDYQSIPFEQWTNQASTLVSQQINKLFPKPPKAPSQASKSPSPTVPAPTETLPLPLTQELKPLKDKLAAIATKHPDLEVGALFVDLDNGAYASLNGEKRFSAASTIKIPILVAFLQEIDNKKAYLDEKLILKSELIGGGSGGMQYQKPGTPFLALHVATEMIIHSDNTATNLIINRTGGAEVLNQRFKDWKLKETVINNQLPDLEGTNTTSPQDLALLLGRIEKGELLSLPARDRLLHIMRRTATRTLLPQGIESDAIIAHKTGDIGKVIGDAGIITLPSGKRYVAAVMVNRPYNDIRGRVTIQEMSQVAYQHFKSYQARPAAPTPQGTSQPELTPFTATPAATPAPTPGP